MVNKNLEVENYIYYDIQKSWTWKRLSEQERKRFMDLHFGIVRGSVKQRKEWVLSMYNAFLAGCGYDGFNWREPEKTTQPLF